MADLEMDIARRAVTRGGRRIDLRPKEYPLLELLMRHRDRPITRSLIVEHVWDMHFDSISNVVDVHINSLRKKIDRGFEVALIHTVPRGRVQVDRQDTVTPHPRPSDWGAITRDP